MVATELLRQLPFRLPFSSMTVGSGGDDGDHCCQGDLERRQWLDDDNDDCNSDTHTEVNDSDADYFLAATDGGQRSV